MYSTTTLVKNSKFSGRIVGTHQQLDGVARSVLGKHLPHSAYFPNAQEIIHFEGTRGPDGLKRKSPGVDEPSHMLTEDPISLHNPSPPSSNTLNSAPVPSPDTPEAATSSAPNTLDPETAPSPSAATGHEHLDERSVLTMILDHRWNLVRALKARDHVRAAFEAAWMAHMITDGLTPAHHFPLSEVKDELMTDKEMVKVFGSPIKGMMHGRNMLETARNNWLYWGAGGHMSKHIAYEYGVLMIAAALPRKKLAPKLTRDDFANLDTEQIFLISLKNVQNRHIYDRFRADGWTTELAIETRDFLLPEIIKCIVLGWYSAAAEGYKLEKRRDK